MGVSHPSGIVTFMADSMLGPSGELGLRSHVTPLHNYSHLQSLNYLAVLVIDALLRCPRKAWEKGGQMKKYTESQKAGRV